MKRRTFLLGALAAPIAPAMPVPRWPAPPALCGTEVLERALADAMFKITNPPVMLVGGRIIWVDDWYDERVAKAFRPATT